MARLYIKPALLNRPTGDPVVSDHIMRRVYIVLTADNPHYATDGLITTPFAGCAVTLTVFTGIACFYPSGETCRSPTTSSLTSRCALRIVITAFPRYLKPVNWLSLAHRLSLHVACRIPQVLVCVIWRLLADYGTMGQSTSPTPPYPRCVPLRDLVHLAQSFRDPIPYSIHSFLKVVKKR